MAQTMVNFRMDEDLKKKMEKVCADMGMSMTTAFTIFAKTEPSVYVQYKVNMLQKNRQNHPTF